MARQRVETAQPSRQNWTKPGPKPWQLGTEIKGGGGQIWKVWFLKFKMMQERWGVEVCPEFTLSNHQENG